MPIRSYFKKEHIVHLYARQFSVSVYLSAPLGSASNAKTLFPQFMILLGQPTWFSERVWQEHKCSATSAPKQTDLVTYIHFSICQGFGASIYPYSQSYFHLFPLKCIDSLMNISHSKLCVSLHYQDKSFCNKRHIFEFGPGVIVTFRPPAKYSPNKPRTLGNTAECHIDSLYWWDHASLLAGWARCGYSNCGYSMAYHVSKPFRCVEVKESSPI